ncbi:GTP-binding protein EngB [Acrasis kona]|uniref:GTP-binding protein EngB n=1 Tax=Acrasis kona TaxID=1008807 RepID=A0AAW2Z9G0_9EUKA
MFNITRFTKPTQYGSWLIRSHVTCRYFGQTIFRDEHDCQDDLVVDSDEELTKWAPLTRLEKREREKIISKAERQQEQEAMKLPDADGFYFRNYKMPSSNTIDPLRKHILQDAEYLFSLPSDIIASCAAMHELPDLKNIPEVAIAGRSNVGKSSFINALLGRDLCVVSQTAGRTRRLNYFNVGRYMYIVDLPGYGFCQRRQTKNTRL